MLRGSSTLLLRFQLSLFYAYENGNSCALKRFQYLTSTSLSTLFVSDSFFLLLMNILLLMFPRKKMLSISFTYFIPLFLRSMLTLKKQIPLSGDLKRICETDLGLISQCCLTKHVFKINRQYLANVALKINVKVCYYLIIKFKLSIKITFQSKRVVTCYSGIFISTYSPALIYFFIFHLIFP